MKIRFLLPVFGLFISTVGAANAQTTFQTASPAQERLWELNTQASVERRKPAQEQVWDDILSGYETLFEESGHSEAAYRLARLYKDAGHTDWYAHWLSKAARAGSPRAQAEFGEYIIDQLENCKDGLPWIALAAENWDEAKTKLEARQTVGSCAQPSANDGD